MASRTKSNISIGGYSVWSVRRTIREAENVARYSPWCAIEWMEEARDRISLENPMYDEFDVAANRINALWRSFEQMHWYNPRDFWMRGKTVYPPQRISTFDDTPAFDINKSIQDILKI
jgi:hypothetical protein|tara:strand:+ start:512 stop:865 length:354 start_codon:yes stop_codon:yes gene_type:complete